WATTRPVKDTKLSWSGRPCRPARSSTARSTTHCAVPERSRSSRNPTPPRSRRVSTQPWRRTSSPTRRLRSWASARSGFVSVGVVLPVMCPPKRGPPSRARGSGAPVLGYAATPRASASGDRRRDWTGRRAGQPRAWAGVYQRPPRVSTRPGAGVMGQDLPQEPRVRFVLRPARPLLEAQHGLERHAGDPAHELGAVDQRVDVLAHPARPHLDA